MKWLLIVYSPNEGDPCSIYLTYLVNRSQRDSHHSPQLVVSRYHIVIMTPWLKDDQLSTFVRVERLGGKQNINSRMIGINLIIYMPVKETIFVLEHPPRCRTSV